MTIGERAGETSAMRQLPVVDREGIRRLRADLTGYTADALHELLGPEVQAALRRRPAPARGALGVGRSPSDRLGPRAGRKWPHPALGRR
jgi:hypothetical protein